MELRSARLWKVTALTGSLHATPLLLAADLCGEQLVSVRLDEASKGAFRHVSAPYIARRGMCCRHTSPDWAKATETSNTLNTRSENMILDKPPEKCKRCPPNFFVTEVFNRDRKADAAGEEEAHQKRSNSLDLAVPGVVHVLVLGCTVRASDAADCFPKPVWAKVCQVSAKAESG